MYMQGLAIIAVGCSTLGSNFMRGKKIKELEAKARINSLPVLDDADVPVENLVAKKRKGCINYKSSVSYSASIMNAKPSVLSDSNVEASVEALETPSLMLPVLVAPSMPPVLVKRPRCFQVLQGGFKALENREDIIDVELISG